MARWVPRPGPRMTASASRRRPRKCRRRSLAQLAPGGRLIGPVGQPHWVQDLVLMIRQDSGTFRRLVVEQVAYIPLRGFYGYDG